MPAYTNVGFPTALARGIPVTVWNAEQPNVGTSSIRVAIPHRRGEVENVSVEIIFSGAPGAFEVDIQTADTDADADYVKTNSIVAVNANNVGRIEIVSLVANFMRLNMQARANAVNVTATIRPQ